MCSQWSFMSHKGKQNCIIRKEVGGAGVHHISRVRLKHVFLSYVQCTLKNIYLRPGNVVQQVEAYAIQT